MRPSCQDKSFSIIPVKPVPLEQVVLLHNPEFDKELTGRQRSQALQQWDTLNQEREIKQLPPLHAGRLFRPMKVELKEGDIIIEAGYTTYFDNYFLRQPMTTWNPDQLIGAGLSVIPLCKDNQILTGKRSQTVGSNAGKWHVVGGHAHPSPRFKVRGDTLKYAVLEELNEEMAVHEDEIHSLRFIGIGIDNARSKPEFLVLATLKNSSEAYLKEWQQIRADQTAQEFDTIITLQAYTGITLNEPWDRIINTLEQNHFVPAAQGALRRYWEIINL